MIGHALAFSAAAAPALLEPHYPFLEALSLYVKAASEQERIRLQSSQRSGRLVRHEDS
jgi:hypothetical protein